MIVKHNPLHEKLIFLTNGERAEKTPSEASTINKKNYSQSYFLLCEKYLSEAIIFVFCVGKNWV